MNPLSKRKLFNAVSLDRRVVDHLDALHLGFLAKRKARVTLAKKFENSDKFNKLENFRSRNRIRGRLHSDTLLNRRVESPYPFNREGKFLFKASDWKSVPRSFPGSPPEIAIIGRSNVGKSTLLNTLLSLEEAPLLKAIVSEKPGETKHLQFYCVGRNEDPRTITEGVAPVAGPALVITDMPGFGFAYMKSDEILRCQEITKLYLTKRGSNLKRVLLLLDARHGLKAGDEQFFRDLFSTTASSLSGEKKSGRDQPIYPGDKLSEVKWKLQIVLTKCDLVERFELARRIQILKQKIKEILPRIGYTSLPILAISSLDNRGIIELKKELATLIMKKEVPATAGSARIEDGRSSGNNEENVTPKKVIRAWKPSDFKVSAELDRSFTVIGGTVDAALAMKDTTRHKQPVGRGTWVSSRVKKGEGKGKGKNETVIDPSKKKGVLIEYTDRSEKQTTLGGFGDFKGSVAEVEEAEKEVQIEREVVKYTSPSVSKMSALIKSTPELDDVDFDFDFHGLGPAYNPFPKPARGTDSWEAKAERAAELKKNEAELLKSDRRANTSLGSLKTVPSGKSSAMTRLNLINSGAPPSFLHPSLIPPESPPTPPKNWNPVKSALKNLSPGVSQIPSAAELDEMDRKRHGMGLGRGAWVSSRESGEQTVVAAAQKKMRIKRVNTSGSLDKQYGERKQLLSLKGLQEEEKYAIKAHAKATIKKARKNTPERAERREKRDIKFGRKSANGDTNIDADAGDFGDDKDKEEEIRAMRPKSSANTDKPSRPVSPKSDGKEASGAERRKSFSKVPGGEPKLKRRQKRYADSFREKKPHTYKMGEESSRTTNFSMAYKKEEPKSAGDDETPSYKLDTTYNDKNAKRPATGRPKTKYGKIVGSKAKSKRAHAAIKEAKKAPGYREKTERDENAAVKKDPIAQMKVFLGKVKTNVFNKSSPLKKKKTV